jgi:hypothetical protein
MKIYIIALKYITLNETVFKIYKINYYKIINIKNIILIKPVVKVAVGEDGGHNK